MGDPWVGADDTRKTCESRSVTASRPGAVDIDVVGEVISPRRLALMRVLTSATLNSGFDRRYASLVRAHYDMNE
jgi:hypothetical protein